MENISEMNQDTVSAKYQDVWSPSNTLHTQSGARHMYDPEAEDIISWSSFCVLFITSEMIFLYYSVSTFIRNIY